MQELKELTTDAWDDIDHNIRFKEYHLKDREYKGEDYLVD